ncbi:hypothetical protein ABLE93_08525 [Xanthobacter sp. KR7-65]|uniref:hypothetical protein n=1 Tax=Xanthobacter sp. KR7-65 TaxID=3156612 RepID=UPI0032B3B834
MNQEVASSARRLPAHDGSRDGLIRRNARLREELRRQARAARMRQSVVRPSAAAFWGAEVRAIAEFRLPLMASFIAVAVVPSLLVAIYFVFFASSQYLSEARFAVRASEHAGLEGLAGAAGLQGLAEVQDSLIIANYVKSLAVVSALDERIHLRELFSRPDIDFFSRFNPNKPIERLEKSWRQQIETAIEAPSGIITVRVWAFSPQDSLKIAQAIVGLSEDMVNRLGERTRTDAIAQSEKEVARAEERLRKARSAVRDLRNEVGVIDPSRTNEGIGKLIGELESDQVLIDQELSTARRMLSPDAPQFALLEARRQAIRENIAILKARLTTGPGSDKDTLSAVMTRYDTLDLERQIAERQYTAAAAALEQARIAAERQGMYLATFVKPVLAQEADWPHRFWMPMAAALVFALAWLLLVSAFELMRHLKA